MIKIVFVPRHRVKVKLIMPMLMRPRRYSMASHLRSHRRMHHRAATVRPHSAQIAIEPRSSATHSRARFGHVIFPEPIKTQFIVVT
jgi:hypothetical protein